MEKIDPSLVDNPLIFPTDEFLDEHLRLHAAERGSVQSCTNATSADATGG